MAYRVERLNSLITRQVSQILLKEEEFPDDVLVTVTRTEVSSNIIQAKVYISVLPNYQKEKVFRILKKDIYAIQQEINKQLRMRPVPKIIFIEEKKTASAADIENLLEKVKKKE